MYFAVSVDCRSRRCKCGIFRLRIHFMTSYANLEKANKTKIRANCSVGDVNVVGTSLNENFVISNGKFLTIDELSIE